MKYFYRRISLSSNGELERLYITKIQYIKEVNAFQIQIVTYVSLSKMARMCLCLQHVVFVLHPVLVSCIKKTGKQFMSLMFVHLIIKMKIEICSIYINLLLHLNL